MATIIDTMAGMDRIPVAAMADIAAVKTIRDTKVIVGIKETDIRDRDMAKTTETRVTEATKDIRASTVTTKTVAGTRAVRATMVIKVIKGTRAIREIVETEQSR